VHGGGVEVVLLKVGKLQANLSFVGTKFVLGKVILLNLNLLHETIGLLHNLIDSDLGNVVFLGEILHFGLQRYTARTSATTTSDRSRDGASKWLYAACTIGGTLEVTAESNAHASRTSGGDGDREEGGK